MKRRAFVKILAALLPGAAILRAIPVPKPIKATIGAWRGFQWKLSDPPIVSDVGSSEPVYIDLEPGGLTREKIRLALELLDEPSPTDSRYIYFDGGWRMFQ